MEKFLVIDCEGHNGLRAYNIGAVVSDNMGIIYAKYSWVLPQALAENFQRALSLEKKSPKVGDMMRNNLWYFTNNFGGFDKFVTEEQFTNELREICEKYKIKKFWAYNAQFDSKMLAKYVPPNIKWYCIMKLAFPHITTKKYVRYCEKFNHLTATGLPSYSAESIYSYWFNEKTETHRGYEDCIDELAILIKAKSKKKKQFDSPHWSIMKKIQQSLPR